MEFELTTVEFSIEELEFTTVETLLTISCSIEFRSELQAESVYFNNESILEGALAL